MPPLPTPPPSYLKSNLTVALAAGNEAFDAAVVERQDVVLFGLGEKEILQLLELVGIFSGDVLRLTEIVVGVVELPLILAEPGRRACDVPWDAVPGHRGPPVVVNSAIAEHFEVLRAVPGRGFRVGEGIHHTDTLDRLLPYAVDKFGLRQPRGLENSRRDIDYVMPLGPDTARVLDARWPRDHRSVSLAAV